MRILYTRQLNHHYTLLFCKVNLVLRFSNNNILGILSKLKKPLL